MNPKTCPICKVVFTSNYTTKVYCSSRCQKKGEARRARARSGKASTRGEIKRNEHGKTCSGCKIFLPWAKFLGDKSKRDRHSSLCRKCKYLADRKALAKAGDYPCEIKRKSKTASRIEARAKASAEKKAIKEKQKIENLVGCAVKKFIQMCRDLGQVDLPKEQLKCLYCGKLFAAKAKTGRGHHKGASKEKRSLAEIKRARFCSVRCSNNYRYSVNPAPALAKASRRRALKIGNGTGGGYRGWLTEIKKKKYIKCYWCGKKTKTAKIHVDHIIPISRGGIDGIENVCAACPTCNLSKHDRLPHEWKGATGFLSL